LSRLTEVVAARHPTGYSAYMRKKAQALRSMMKIQELDYISFVLFPDLAPPAKYPCAYPIATHIAKEEFRATISADATTGNL
jgi:hypothetical protein